MIDQPPVTITEARPVAWQAVFTTVGGRVGRCRREKRRVVCRAWVRLDEDTTMVGPIVVTRGRGGLRAEPFWTWIGFQNDESRPAPKD